MSLSFAVSRPAVSLWWALFWRGLVWTLILLIPLVAVSFVGSLITGILLVVLSYVLPSFAMMLVTLVFGLAGLVIRSLLFPAILSGLSFKWIFRKGRIGKYAISGKYNGESVTTWSAAMKYGIWYYVENIMYVWPLLILCVALGAAISIFRITDNAVAVAIMLMFPLYIYMYLLVITDLIKRRRFNRCELVVEAQS